MNLVDIIYGLSYVTKVLVTGPQRSGTTFMAYALAKDLGWKYIDEAVFQVDDKNLFKKLLSRDENLVIQCPGIMRWISSYDNEKNLIVLMRRDTKAIIKSEKNRGWGFELYEKGKYRDTGTEDLMVRPISIIKYDWFDKVQIKNIRFSKVIGIKYPEDVSNHPLYISDDDRINWGIKQVLPNQAWIEVDRDFLK